MRWRAALVGVALATGVLGVGAPALAAGPGPAPARFLQPGLRPALTAPSPHPGSTSNLDGAYCVSSGNCWAVGQDEKSGAQVNEILHWNGTSWSQVSTPEPGGTGSEDVAQLYGVRCVSASDCWAVGYYEKGKADLNEILRWNGSKWSQVKAPTPAGTLAEDINELFSVTCVTASDCWAGGYYGTFNGLFTYRNEMLHWNGSAWSQVAVPQPAGGSQGAVADVSAIRCTSASSCWAAGSYGHTSASFSLRNEILRWNGKSWSQSAPPNPAGTASSDINELTGLTCTSAANCWAVGSYLTEGSGGSGPEYNEALHWNGKSWSKASPPNPDGTGSGAENVLNDVFCGSAGNCWAVGSFGSETIGAGSIKNQTLHYNGKSWAKVTAPNPVGTAGGDASVLYSVRCTGTKACWAVGNQDNGAGLNINEILRWNGTKWAAS